MKSQRTGKAFLLAGVGIFALIMLGSAYGYRHALRDAFARATAPALPAEEAYQPPVAQTDPELTEPEVKETVAGEDPKDALPAEKRLAIPFMTQAPHANWDMPYQEACEEASILMVAGYYAGERGVIDVDDADRRILDLVAYETDEMDLPADITAAEAVDVIEARYPDLQARVVPLNGADSVKQYIARGIPVILPADGKTLPNPNFRNGGPRYHMLVVRGYTADRFITNDPGTRNGQNFLYTYEGLLDAVHDWNGGDVPNGDPVMLIVEPR